MRAAAAEGYTTATAVADALVRRGVAVPERPPHRRSLVAQAEAAGIGLDAVPDAMIGLALGASGDPDGRRARRGPGHWRRAPRGSLDRRRPGVVRRHRRDRPDPGRAPPSRRPGRASTRPERTWRRATIAPAPPRSSMPDLATIVRAPKALLHDHLDGGLRPGHGHRPGARSTATTALPTTDVDELADLVPPWRRPQEPGALSRDVRPHRRGDAGARRDRPGRRRVRRGPRRRWGGLRRGPDGSRAVHRARADPRRGDDRDPRRLPDRRRERGRGAATRS